VAAGSSISELSPFGACAHLQELYLRKNEVTALDEVRHLEKLPALRVLWLCDNPCADHPDYRAR
jgi:Leucine-rich repeat (LRR) protein